MADVSKISPFKGALLGGVGSALAVVTLGQRFIPGVQDSMQMTLIAVGVGLLVGGVAGYLLVRFLKSQTRP